MSNRAGDEHLERTPLSGQRRKTGAGIHRGAGGGLRMGGHNEFSSWLAPARICGSVGMLDWGIDRPGRGRLQTINSHATDKFFSSEINRLKKPLTVYITADIFVLRLVFGAPYV